MMRKKINGKKRDILVDALGLLLHAIVHPADIQDRDGGILLLATLLGMYPFLKKLLPTAAIRGRNSRRPWRKSFPISKLKSSSAPIEPKDLWCFHAVGVVERTIAWLNRCRRLAKDWENLNRKALASLRLASIRLMLRKLCNPA
jgi:transposase